MKTSFSCDADVLCSYFLKKLSFSLCKPLSYIFQFCFSKASLPSHWKRAVVVPIHKKGDTSKVSNFRPVSLCSVPCKLMERVINSSLLSFLETRNLLSKNQFGFRKNKSCSLQLLKCKNDWTNMIDKGNSVDVVYIDFCKAFDTVSHQKLIMKLSKYGIHADILLWIKDFLSERTQNVKIGNSLSSTMKVTSGVPQGSVLGPTLFLVYINDLLDINIHSSVCLFADDVKVYNDSSKSNLLSLDLKLISDWAKKWQLQISFEKSSVLYLGKSNPLNVYRIYENNLPANDEVKDLGVTMHKTLSSSVHCNIIVKKARLFSNLIVRSFFSRNTAIMIKAFLIYVRPILEYATVVWNPSLKKDIELIESVQRRFTKRILRHKSLSYKQRLDYFALESLEKRRLTFDLTAVYNIIKNNVLPFDDFVQFNTNMTRSNHPYKLCLPKS